MSWWPRSHISGRPTMLSSLCVGRTVVIYYASPHKRNTFSKMNCNYELFFLHRRIDDYLLDETNFDFTFMAWNVRIRARQIKSLTHMFNQSKSYIANQMKQSNDVLNAKPLCGFMASHKLPTQQYSQCGNENGENRFAIRCTANATVGPLYIHKLHKSRAINRRLERISHLSILSAIVCRHRNKLWGLILLLYFGWCFCYHHAARTHDRRTVPAIVW